MSERIIQLPDIGEGITEAEIVEWLVAIGEDVSEDQIIGSVMTDKAAVEIPSPVTGVIVALTGEVGDVLPVGSEYARIRTREDLADHPEAATETVPGASAPVEPGSSSTKNQGGRAARVPETAQTAQAAQAAPAAPAAETAAAAEAAQAAAAAAAAETAAAAQAAAAMRQASTFKPAASPSVRRHAYRKGVALGELRGSGPGGRILHEDIQDFLVRGETSRPEAVKHHTESERPPATSQDVEEIRVVGMRRAIARRMQRAKQRIPHFSYVEEIDVTTLESMRAELNEHAEGRYPRLTVLPFIIMAVLHSLREFPRLNSRYDDEAEIIRQYRNMHVGIATQTDNGLMVPVIRSAEKMDIRSLASAITHAAAAAREGRLVPADMQESTITITSLGALGGLVSTPVINHPEVAIVGVNRIVTRPMFQGDRIVPRQLMNLSCSFDHRVVDGHDAASFVQVIRKHLELPVSLFVPV